MNIAAVSFWSVQSPSQDEHGRVQRETNVLKLAICFCIDLHCSNSTAHSVQQASMPTCCECGVISRHIPTRVCSLFWGSGLSAVVLPFYARFSCLYCLKSFLLILLLMLRTGIAADGLSFLRVRVFSIWCWNFCSTRTSSHERRLA